MSNNVLHDGNVEYGIWKPLTTVFLYLFDILIFNKNTYEAFKNEGFTYKRQKQKQHKFGEGCS